MLKTRRGPFKQIIKARRQQQIALLKGLKEPASFDPRASRTAAWNKHEALWIDPAAMRQHPRPDATGHRNSSALV